jgi:hypothetical protein
MFRVREQDSKESASLACYTIHTGFVLALFFGPEAGGDMFNRNVSYLSTDCVL